MPMCSALAAFLKQWKQETPYSGDDDFIFPSMKLRGRKPLWGQTLNADYIKPTAIKLGLVVNGERFGWHNFRHSLSTWANDKTKDITISTTLLRHAKPDITTLYTHGDFAKALGTQRPYMKELMSQATMPNPGPSKHRARHRAGGRFRRSDKQAADPRKCPPKNALEVVGAVGFEPTTSTV